MCISRIEISDNLILSKISVKTVHFMNDCGQFKGVTIYPGRGKTGMQSFRLKPTDFVGIKVKFFSNPVQTWS
jgi:hypothetical protein